MARGKKKESFTIEEKLEQALVPREEWPYEVPENWCWVEIGKITEVVGGGTPSTSHKEYYDNGNISWISPADLSGYDDVYIQAGKKYITQLGLEKSSARLLPKNTVCLSTRAPIGYVVIADNELCTNQGFKSFLPSENYLPKYLYWYLKGNKDMLESMASGTTFLELSSSKAAKIFFPLPPLSEQQRIVERIESLFAKLDEAKEKAQEVLDSFVNRRIMILRNAFNGKISKKWRNQKGYSKSNWKRKTLSDCSSVIGDGLHGTPEYDKEGDYYFINGNNLEYDHIEYKADTKRVNRKEYEKHYIKLDDTTVFVSINGTLGKTAFYCNEPVILGKSVCYINTDDKLDKHYLRYFFFTKEFSDYANKKATGSTIKNLGLKAIRMLEINIPSIGEQKEIVSILDEIFAKENQVYKIVIMLITQIELIKKSILAKAFRGELGTNDPTEESSMELLKRILEEAD